MVRDSQEQKDLYVQEIRRQVLGSLHEQEQKFKYCNNECLLYTIVESKGNARMITWNLESIIENLEYGKLSYKIQIPMFVNAINLFSKLPNNCLINFNPLIIRNYYNKNQFKFFFSDEVVTDSVSYTSFDHPCLIIGTNYGRIFMIPMF